MVKSKRFLCGIILFLSNFCYSPYIFSAELKELIKRVKPAVVRVICERDAGTGYGSGFIISPNGDIITCYHVIEGSKNIKIQFYDGSIKIAKLDSGIYKTSDAHDYDFAVLKIDGTNLPFLEFSERKDFEEGEAVFFCGYPFGMDIHTTHTGTISAIATKLFIIGTDTLKGTKLQVDGSINKGNSGGPLLDISSGKVIGIITTKYMLLGEELEKAKNRARGSRSSVRAIIAGVDMGVFVEETVNALKNYMNLGIGDAVSVEYIQNYLKSRKDK